MCCCNGVLCSEFLFTSMAYLSYWKNRQCGGCFLLPVCGAFIALVQLTLPRNALLACYEVCAGGYKQGSSGAFLLDTLDFFFM